MLTSRLDSVMNLVLVLLILVLLAAHALAHGEPAAPWDAGRHEIAIRHDDLDRTAIVHVPHGDVPVGGWPVVLMLHGGGGSAAQLERNSNWAKLAPEAGFVLILPNGTTADPTKKGSFVANPQTWHWGLVSALTVPRQLCPAVLLSKRTPDNANSLQLYPLFLASPSRG